jgi:Zn-dependent protease/Tfp pilus assembly protein PilF
MMQWLNRSWKVGHINGAEIRLHSSMLLIVPVVYMLFRPTSGLEWALALLTMIGLLFSVLLHEFGHTLTAQLFKIEVKSIILWPLGGFSNLGRPPEKPIHNVLICAAGPVVSLMLTLMLGIVGLAMWFFGFGGIFQSIVISLAFINLTLLFFNLLPIYPLDGGGIFHSLVEMIFGQSAANSLSIIVGVPFLLGLMLLSVVIRDPILFVFCILLFLSIGTLNARMRRWINMGYCYLFKRHLYYYMAGEFDLAIQTYTHLLAKNPKDADSLLMRGINHLAAADLESAQADLKATLSIAPKNPTALEFLAEIHALNKEYDVALEIIERVNTIKPDWFLTHFDRGSIYLDQNQIDAALREFNRTIELRTDAPLFYLARSVVHFRQQNITLAHQDQAKALKLSLQDSLTMSEINMGFYRDCLDWAEDYFGWVVKKYPRQWMAYQGRADAYQINGQLMPAIADYNRAIELAPRQAVPYLRRGMAYQKSGQPTLAAEDFRSAQKLARKAHIRRRAGQLLETIG